MFAFASLASYLALRRIGRHTWKNPAGLVLGLLFLAGIMAMAAPNIHGPERPRRTKCTSNLTQISYACQLYAEDNGDAFPPDLPALYGDYITDPQLFVCPTVAGEGHVPRPRYRPFRPEAVCYAYVSGLRASDDGEFIFAFDEEWNHGRKGVISVRIGGQVGWTNDIELFHVEQEEQRAALAAEGRRVRVIRPTWSREPDPPAYPVRPWHERPVAIVLCVLVALALAGGAVAFILKRRRAIRASSAGG
jgi:hypothetical protein